MRLKKESDNHNGYRNKIEESLLKDRTVLIYGEISQRRAKEITEKLLVLASESDDDIRIFINSQGGHVEAGDTIFDMIRFVKPKVKIVGTGWVASAGALIYCAVPKEQRFSLPNTRFMIHQPMGGVGGPASDVAIEAKEIVRMKERLNKIIAEATGQKLDKVTADSDRNFWMNPQEAIDYGLAGKIVQSAAELG